MKQTNDPIDAIEAMILATHDVTRNGKRVPKYRGPEFRHCVVLATNPKIRESLTEDDIERAGSLLRLLLRKLFLLGYDAASERFNGDDERQRNERLDKAMASLEAKYGTNT